MKPEPGKTYALTSASGPSIANGNTWEESVRYGWPTIVPMTLAEARAISDDKEDAKRFDKKPFLGQKCRD
tara:strand:- start:121 stop:330 length:210 start_codon:yes stop_codon:yes gene_type:complete